MIVHRLLCFFGVCSMTFFGIAINSVQAADEHIEKMPQNFSITSFIPHQRYNGSVEVTSHVLVEWKTAEPTTSVVYYGDGSYQRSIRVQKPPSQTHAVTISGLPPSEVVLISVESFTTDGKVYQSETMQTVTPKVPRAAIDIIRGNILEMFGFLYQSTVTQ
ncbi:MAG: hypothetical protein ACOCXQ_05060 [Patescibacteria group bacterium]